MSTQDESGVYYPPSLGFPNHHHHHLHHLGNQDHLQQHQGYSDHDAFKQCSVKGCTDVLSSDGTNKMCDGCRGRHRIYASTKRARRKLEKVAVVTPAVAVSARPDSSKDDAGEMFSLEHTPQRITWVNASGQAHQDPRLATLSILPTWNLAIDSRLFPGDGSPGSPHHLSPLMPHQTSTSSELANALTPRQASTPAPIIASAVLPVQTATDYSQHYHDGSALHLQAPQSSVASGRGGDDSNDHDEEEQVVASLQTTALQDQDMSSDQQTSAELSQGRSSEEVVDGSTRFCSVKGCKTIIPDLYEYKMCPPCRTRYRTYGNTKRAKWKAERDAFDREMAHLKTLEDEKRKAKGLRPLDECPEELRAWELLVIDEQLPALSVDSVLLESLSPSPNPPSSSTIDYQLNDNPLLAAAANTSLPARMCTVTHCHKILPGYYRYKRCEQHRLQNRHHSQLKRVREKEVRAVGATEEESDKLEQATIVDGAKEAHIAMTAGDADTQKVKSHDQKRSKFSCSAGECHNLILPTVRWRLCEPCRCLDRRRKNKIRAEQNTAADNMNTIPHTEGAAQGAQETQETNNDSSAGAVDPDAEGDIDMGENEDETEPKAVENQQSIVAPMAPPSMPPAPMTSGFSRFHVTIDPRNATSSSSALDPTTSTAKLVTLDDPLAFRAYRPKTTPSAIGRILARNPGLSVDAFTEVLQAEGANTGAMTLNQTSATKSIITPTIPTSTPFVYKAPEKKAASTKGAAGKGKRRAASEKQSTSSSTTPATPTQTPTPASASGVPDSSASAPPGPYGAYGYPPYPHPYPYYIPSPYGMPPYPYPQAPPPAPSEKTKPKSSSKSSTSAATSSSTQMPPSMVMPVYPPYPYPYPPPPPPYGYPPPPNGYSYIPTRYVPGQPPFNGLPPGPSGANTYPYPYYPPPPPPPVPTPISTLPISITPAPFPKTAAAARERQRTQDTKFNYYHYGAGSSDSPTIPNDVTKKRRKRRKVDPEYLEKFKAQTEAISMSLAMDQARRDDASSSGPTVPPASLASGNSDLAPPTSSVTQPMDGETPSKPMSSTRLCVNKTCHRPLVVDTANNMCDRCRLRFKKHQAKTKKRFKLEPRKFLFVGKTK